MAAAIFNLGAFSEAEAQEYFEPFWLSDLPLSTDWFSDYSGVIPGTSIPITIQVRAPDGVNNWAWKDATGSYTSDGLPAIAIGGEGYSNGIVNFTITLGAPSAFVKLKLDDYDRINGGAVHEWVGNLNDTLGEPDSIESFLTPGGIQMNYYPDFNGMLSYAPAETGDWHAGITVATWEDFNGTTISFTSYKSVPELWALFDMQLGNPVPVPETSSTLLGLMGAASCLAWRRSRQASWTVLSVADRRRLVAPVVPVMLPKHCAAVVSRDLSDCSNKEGGG